MQNMHVALVILKRTFDFSASTVSCFELLVEVGGDFAAVAGDGVIAIDVEDFTAVELDVTGEEIVPPEEL